MKQRFTNPSYRIGQTLKVGNRRRLWTAERAHNTFKAIINEFEEPPGHRRCENCAPLWTGVWPKGAPPPISKARK